MKGSDDGPTRGAYEEAGDTRWQASPAAAFLIRSLVFAGPIVGAFGGLLLVAGMLYRPPGTIGAAVWFVQGLVVSTVLSMTLERLARGLLPLASLFSVSLVFPDQAPSRFGVALRAGSLRRLQEQTAGAPQTLGADPSTAATRAVEFVTALSRHDRLTRGHTERVRAYADLIAAEMGLSAADRSQLSWGVMLHDIGKIAVPAEVLNKTEKLTDEEWATLRGHPAAGERLMTPLRGWLGSWALAASEHHERWDGGGYPHGLAGREISLAGRITAVADAYDVITSRRSYKEPMSPAAARRELVLCAGSQFDPDVVRAFLNVSLSRRWSAGLLAALSHLPFGNLGTAPAAVVVGLAATAGSVVAGVAPAEVVDTLAFTETTQEIAADGSSTTTVESGPAPSTTADPSVPAAEPEPEPETESIVVEPAPTTQTTVATSRPDPPSSTESSSASTTAPTSSAPTSSAATVSTTSTTVPPSTANPSTTTTTPTTSTTAPSTTTSPTTTTTTTATTTTTTLPMSLYHLKNPGTGDSIAALFKSLETAGPDNATQPNYDILRDSVPGLRLEPTTSGWSESDTRRIQRFFLDPTDGAVLSGPVVLRVWAATDQAGVTATLRAALSICDWVGSNCTDLSDGSQTTTSRWSDGFEELVYDFGSPTHVFGPDDRLVVRLITEGAHTVHTGFDADPHPSRLQVALS